MPEFVSLPRVVDDVSGDQARWDQQRLDDVSLEDHLERVLSSTMEADRDPCLVFDQFEELFTLDPADWDEKQAFLTELGIALRKKSRWALFAMREDYIAQLDPLLSLMPTRLTARNRLDLLEPDAARLAVVRPAEIAGAKFAPNAADDLIDDLRKTQVNRGGQTLAVPGRYVEPVVLQAVCRRLWEQSGSQESIGRADVAALGDVDDTLADFCDDRFATAAVESGASEQRIREWIERELITDRGFRSQTVSGPTDVGPAVLRSLEDGHLLRAESRRGTTWYEIPHDRLVAPIRTSNRRWLEANLDPVQSAARHWDEHDRAADMLFRGILLDTAEEWVAAHPADVLQVDREFVEAGRDEDRRVAKGRRRTFAGVGLVAFIVAIASYLFVDYQASRAETDTAVARAAQAEAEAAAADAEKDAALSREAEALAASAAARSAETEAEAARQVAAEALTEMEQAVEESEAAAADRETAETLAAETAADLDAARETAADEATIRELEEIANAAAAEATIAVSESETTASAASAAIDEADEAKEAAADADATAEETWDGVYVDEPAFPALTVKLGDRGATVGWLQQELRARGASITPDCSYGYVTEDAVKDLQTANGLTATGLADDESWKLFDVDVESPDRLFSCFDRGQPDSDGDRCQRAHPTQRVALVVRNISNDDPDGGLNFRPEPNLENAALYPAPNGTQFTATGACRVGPSTTNWWEMIDMSGNVGWAGSGSLFIDLRAPAATDPARPADEL